MPSRWLEEASVKKPPQMQGYQANEKSTLTKAVMAGSGHWPTW